MNRSVLIAIVIAAAVGIWIASGQFGSGPQMAAVTVEKDASEESGDDKVLPSVRYVDSTARMSPEVVRVFGRTEADRSVTIRAETAGPVAEIVATEGFKLETGSVVVRLDIEDRESVLEEAEGELRYRDKSYRASEQLSKKQFSSEVKLAEEAAALARAKAAVAAARLDIAHTRIKTPFEGVVDNIDVETGDVVAVGDPIAYIADLDPIVVAVGISERDITSVRPGDRAFVHIVGRERAVGYVRFVSRSGDAATRTFRVEIAMDNPDYEIAEGLTAEVVLETKRRLSHQISPAALTLDDEGRLGVMTVGDDDRAAFAPVEIVRDEVDGVWITGLGENVRIIVTGQSFVTDGDPVMPVKVAN
ncbi:MAG: efflux RND transporter periplasmic adaptor subunit [Rhodospirillales bacterium]